MMCSAFWCSWTTNASRAGAIQYCAVGVMYILLPVINRSYRAKEERAEVLVRRITWLNITMHINNSTMGPVTSMEKQNNESENFDASFITVVRTLSVGPLLGISDSSLWGILRVIAAGVGVSLTSIGSSLGAIVFLFLYNVPAFLIRYYVSYSGYSIGESLIQKIYESGGMKVFTKVSNMLGLMMMGSMIASDVKFKTTFKISARGNEDVAKIQDYLGQLLVGIVSLVAALLALWLLRKKVNANVTMSDIILLGILLGSLGIY